ncbi:uncharacterized protein LOC134208840 [Armigeres subalbatus]|uniref:uncharacterized protein LOC134208840 n=1 Tax=Armigeres subalbatus TaxID=124917 RepID=UPI002ED5F7AA
MENERRALELQKILHKKRLEHQKALFLMRQQAEQEQREMDLEYEKEQMELQAAKVEAHQKKKRDEVWKEVRGKLEKMNIDPVKKYVERQYKTEGALGGEDERIKGEKKERSRDAISETRDREIEKLEKRKSGRSDREKEELSNKREDFRGAFRKYSTPKASDVAPLIYRRRKDSSIAKSSSVSEYSGESEEVEEDSSSEEEENFEKAPKETYHRPSKAQLSARQFLSKKLPTFTGRLEEWPMFISAYETSNAACGFSNVENLARLQECLKGQALEAVRSRLLLPSAVPHIIKTLRMLYGRPDQLLNMLLVNVRKAPSPRADKLASYIKFGVVVQQLTDHLEATGLTAHLVNPMLIQELTEKLPANTQLEWVRYRRKSKIVTLRTLSNFLSRIVNDASEITPYSETATVAVDQAFRRKKERREQEGFLHTHSSDTSDQASLSTNVQQREKKPCRICGRCDHRIRNCEAFKRLRLPERWEAVRKWKLCYLCLNEHGSARCKLNFRCNVNRCNERHNPLLHIDQTVSTNCNIHSLQRQSRSWTKGRLTLVEKSLVHALHAKGVTQPLRVTWTAGVTRIEKDSQRVELNISARGSSQRFRIMAAHTVDNLKLPQQTVTMSNVINDHSHLRGLPVADNYRGAPQILIGLKDIHLYAPLESRIGKPDEPIAVRSKLGWTIYGPSSASGSDSGVIGHHHCEAVSNQELHDLLRSHFKLEESVISVALLPESDEDKRAKDILNKTTVRVGDRFETGMLWKEEQVRFPTATRWPTQQELEEFEPQEVCYLPLSVVVHPKKPGKVRLVWDASAVVNGVSFNSKLLKGPDMLTPLPNVLAKFRERMVGFGGDIKEMYLQVRVCKADKRARFVFRESPSKVVKVYVIDVTLFGATSSPCTAQFVKNRNAQEYAVQFPEAARAIVENHYVDDYFDSVDTIEESVKRTQEVKYVHAKGGF